MMSPLYLTVFLALAPVAQVDPPGFLMWSAAELEEHSEALGTRVGPDGSSRETLADYRTPSGGHRFRFIRRDSDGRPEQHDNIEDVVFIQSGEGTLLVGGEMLGRTGDLGTSITGGWRYPVAAGDVLRIPAGTPHAYLVPDGGHVTYLLTRVPRFTGRVVTDSDGAAPQLDPPGFGMWWSSELDQRNAALATRVGPDDSSRETLGDYGPGGVAHRFRFIRREGDGRPEIHDNVIDVVFIQSGGGILRVGGEMIGQSNRPGSAIDGGDLFPVNAGDVLHIPANTPHAYLVPDGHITYVLVRVPIVGG